MSTLQNKPLDIQSLNDPHLTETTLSSEIMAQGKMLTVRYDQALLPNGTTSGREYVIHPGAVVVIALTSQCEVVLERQFRYPLKQVFIELPAGKIDAGEPVLTTGQRELLEETGYTASEWIKLGIQHPCIGYSNEVIHIYLALGLQLGAHQRDIDEAMDVFCWPFAHVMQAIEAGEITDSKTMSAMLLAERYLRKHPQPGMLV
ncbi:NUDIX domain-containing protein [Methylophilus aquaticus]|uniref:GDP-mannose pyrophosphatase n=1 Tax=Methylophilus aquaticus TaxID=1971610 RepID=A0ABT9JXF6_9PROT|nr:NUDIX hydrolase [Methylophilus aquaticus]MDP8568736.1 NUDIX hydrolase [Methylophilus aquaticus]